MDFIKPGIPIPLWADHDPSPGPGPTPESVPSKGVDFIDYDGTILYSYTPDEIQELTELPPNPTHSGLLSQGWNWALEKLKEYGGNNTVGQFYITDDGKTRIGIHIPDKIAMTFPLTFTQYKEYGVEIDWGDGSAPEAYPGSGKVNSTHTYPSPGDYEITLNPVNSSLDFNDPIITDININNNVNYGNMVQYVNMGRRTSSIGSSCFSYCMSLKTITIHDFNYIMSYAFSNCHSLVSVTLPNTLPHIFNNMFNNCYNLKNVSLPRSAYVIENSSFNSCNSLRKIDIKGNVNLIEGGSFSGDFSLTNVTIPSSVTKIGDNSFGYCTSIKFYHIKPTSPPTISNMYVFYSIPDECPIYVPDNSIEAYKTASGWAELADHIKPESEMQEEWR